MTISVISIFTSIDSKDHRRLTVIAAEHGIARSEIYRLALEYALTCGGLEHYVVKHAGVDILGLEDVEVKNG